MSYFSQAIEQLRLASQSNDDELLSDACIALGDATVEEGHWPPGFFEDVINLLSDSSFLAARNSWKLLLFVRSNWQQLSQANISAFKETLIGSFDKFGDWTGHFLASEMLGEFYPSGATLAILAQLEKTAGMPAKVAIPHGFETLAKTTEDRTLSALAVQQLEKLLEDDSEEVRKEAALSLQKVLHQ